MPVINPKAKLTHILRPKRQKRTDEQLILRVFQRYPQLRSLAAVVFAQMVRMPLTCRVVVTDEVPTFVYFDVVDIQPIWPEGRMAIISEVDGKPCIRRCFPAQCAFDEPDHLRFFIFRNR